MFEIDQASKFLSALTAADKGDTQFSFQTFDDDETRDDKSLAKIRSGTLDQFKDFLLTMNEQRAGVFVAVNRISGRRSNVNVQELRAAFIDCDNVEVSFDDVEQKPNIIVQSARGKHAYWLLQRGESLDRFYAIQTALAAKFGTDAQVNDLARVMRLPGFEHHKKDPLLVEVEHVDTETIYTIDELFEGMHLEEFKPKDLALPKPTYINMKPSESRRDISLEDKIHRCESYLVGIGPAIEGSGGHATTVQACRAGHDFDLPESVFWPMLLQWNRNCSPPWTDEQLRYTYEHSASKYPAGNKLDVDRRNSRWTPSAADVRVPSSEPWHSSDPGIAGRVIQLDEPVAALPPVRDGWAERETGVHLKVIQGGDERVEEAETNAAGTPTEDADTKGEEKKRKKKKKVTPANRMSVAEILSDRPPIYGDLDRDPLHASHLLCKEYDVAHEDSGQWYAYDTLKWLPTSKHTIEKMLVQYTTPDDFCINYLNETIARIKGKKHMRKIEWNQVGETEVPVLDGVYNFMTDELRAHRPGDYLERVTPYRYNSTAICPTWHRCLEDWLPGKDEEKLALQLFLGYCLMPHARYKKALMLYGKPHTGKSQICMVATMLVGGKDYTCGILPSKMNDPRACAPIKGAALNVIPDLPKDQLIGDGGFKAMVSAGDTIQIDQKHIAPEQYTPTAKHIFATNNLPSINDPSSGVFERLLMIHFDNVIPEENRDPNLEQKIKEEIEGVLAWAIQGAKMLYEMNGRWPDVKSSIEAIEKYKLDENPIYDFIEESGRVLKSNNGRVSIERFTEMFNEYHSGRLWTKRAVRARLEALGYSDCTMNSSSSGRITRKRAVKGLVEIGEHLSILEEEDSEELDENA